MAKNLKIKTDRLIIRTIASSDLAPIKSMLKNEKVMKTTGLRKPQSHEQIKFLFDKWIDLSTKSYYLSIIGLDDTYYGWVMLKYTISNCYEFGYMLDEEYWNQGYMTEASIKILKHFEAESFDIYAKVDSYNLSSINVLLKSGFKKIQTEKEVITYKYCS